MTTPVDVGTAICTALLAAANDVMVARSIDPADRPALVVHAAGSAIPVADACAGMLWARVGAQFPTDGSGQPFTKSRETFDPPAWAITVELGALFCHENINEDGTWISVEQEGAYAARDGMWRTVLAEAVAYGWQPQRPALLEQAVLGQAIGPWTPVGPDGGYSGGTMTLTVVVGGLWLC